MPTILFYDLFFFNLKQLASIYQINVWVRPLLHRLCKGKTRNGILWKEMRLVPGKRWSWNIFHALLKKDLANEAVNASIVSLWNCFQLSKKLTITNQYIYIYIYIYIWLYVRIWVWMNDNTYLCVCLHKCVYLYRCIYIYIHSFIHAYIHVHVKTCVYMCVCVCGGVCVCMFSIYIYMCVCVCVGGWVQVIHACKFSSFLPFSLSLDLPLYIYIYIYIYIYPDTYV